MVDPQRPPGWLPDPSGRYQFRWFNGTAFTADVSTQGNRFVDPLPLIPITEQPTRGMAVAGFVIALVAAMLAWLPFVFVGGGLAAIAGFIFSLLGLRASRRQAGYARGLAVSGIAISVLAAGLTVAGFYFTRFAVRELDKIGDLGEYEAMVDSCTSKDGLTILDGHVTNLDDRRHDYYVDVEFVVDDRVVTGRYVSVGSLDPGERGALHAAEFIDSNHVECQIRDVSALVGMP